jgi:hypothetical protein
MENSISKTDQLSEIDSTSGTGKREPVIARARKIVVRVLRTLVPRGKKGKAVLAGFAVFIVLVVASVIIRMIMKKQSDDGVYNITPSGLTPTPVGHYSYRPSIWVNDPEVMKLGEDVDVLKSEISQTSLREVVQSPPTLDFRVSF